MTYVTRTALLANNLQLKATIESLDTEISILKTKLEFINSFFLKLSASDVLKEKITSLELEISKLKANPDVSDKYNELLNEKLQLEKQIALVQFQNMQYAGKVNQLEYQLKQLEDKLKKMQG